MCQPGCYLTGMGVALVILGVVDTFFGIGALAAFPRNYFSRVGAPIWTGLFVVLTGVIGIMAGRKFKQTGTHSGFTAAFLTLSILGIFVAWAQLGMSSWAIAIYGYSCSPSIVRIFDLSAISVTTLNQANGYCWTMIHLHRAGAALGGLVVIMCLVSSILGCVACCNRGNQQPGQSGMSMQPTNQPDTANYPPAVRGAYNPQARYI
ncbi:Hypp7635 [Branchiostoma lanceolatum]|uniref:Hypp7635 protein n=1 Tax=Branchiostoma lanceolatum TaxID=7740 RepID=A0A8J9Z2R7_BRALA|nr:Hypp7635 [Branchiostoma lanceolatum]